MIKDIIANLDVDSSREVKRTSAPPPECPLTEVLPTRYARGEFVSAGPIIGMQRAPILAPGRLQLCAVAPLIAPTAWKPHREEGVIV
jgi:hypothetical protein